MYHGLNGKLYETTDVGLGTAVCEIYSFPSTQKDFQFIIDEMNKNDEGNYE
jgi:hypothetical protein